MPASLSDSSTNPRLVELFDATPLLDVETQLYPW